MIEEARKRQQAMGLVNMDWRVGDVVLLPFPESSFSAVITRYSFHHFLNHRRYGQKWCGSASRAAKWRWWTCSCPARAGRGIQPHGEVRDASHTRAAAGGTDGMSTTPVDGDETAFYKLDVELENCYGFMHQA